MIGSEQRAVDRGIMERETLKKEAQTVTYCVIRRVTIQTMVSLCKQTINILSLFKKVFNSCETYYLCRQNTI